MTIEIRDKALLQIRRLKIKYPYLLDKDLIDCVNDIFECEHEFRPVQEFIGDKLINAKLGSCVKCGYKPNSNLHD